MKKTLLAICISFLLSGCISVRNYDHVDVHVEVSADGAQVDAKLDASVMPGVL